MNEIKNYRGTVVTRESVLSQVGPGWRMLVNTLIDDLFSAGWDGSLHQIKEKFGGLRFYTGALSGRQHDLVKAASLASEKTCETCGMPGEIRGNSWVRATCDEHADKKECNR